MKKLNFNQEKVDLDISKSKKIIEDAGIEFNWRPVCRQYDAKDFGPAIQDINYVVATVERYDEKAFEMLPNLEMIARFGAGMETVDLEAATRHGVVVCNAPGVNAFSVAEHATALMLSLVRKITERDRQVRKAEWLPGMSTALNGTFGIMGFGNIPQKLASILQPWPVKVLAYDVAPNKEAAEKLGVTLVDLPTLLAESDFISNHVPHFPSTENLINDETIGMMKEGVYFVNTSRGALVDEEALLRGLKSGKIGGAGLDVLKEEPVSADNPLITMDNVIITPHSAFGSDAAFLAVLESCCLAVAEYDRGEMPRFCRNPELLKDRV